MSEAKTEPTMTDYENGDLMLYPINGRYVLGIIEKKEPPRPHLWIGDMCLRTEDMRGFVWPKHLASPEAARFIGTSFASVEEARTTLRSFWVAGGADGRAAAS